MVPIGGWLLIVTLLCLTRMRKAGELTSGMAWAQAGAWVGLFVFGLTAVEGAGDRFWGPSLPFNHDDRPRSRLTELAGRSPELAATSESIADAALAVALTAWLVLFVLLVLDVRRRLVSEPVSDERPVPSGPASRRSDLRERKRARTPRNAAAKG